MTHLSADEVRRYARQLIVHDIGGRGQQALKAARVLVVGAGGLGSPVIQYLTGAGVGTIGIADNDDVSVSNLHRQLLHASADVGRPKVLSAVTFIKNHNPHVEAIGHTDRIVDGNSDRILAGYDYVIDGSDNIATRRVVALAASRGGKPLVAGAVNILDGHVTVFMPAGDDLTGTFDAIYPVEMSDGDAPSCEMTGVLGASAGVIGTLMAMEAIKLITGVGQPLVGRLLLFDGRAGRFTEIVY